MAQIESVAGIRNVESIANVTGVDVLFVGPADLRHDLQHCGEANTGNYDECLMKVINATSAAEKTAGILLRELEMIEPHIEAGFTHIAVDSDLAIIQRAYHEIVAQNPRCER